MNIGERIKKLREINNISQQDLATALNVGRESIARWENGTRDLKTGSIIALANYFNVSADYLLGLSDTPTNNKDLAAVCEFTGLSANAINNIYDYCIDFEQPKNILRILNKILETDLFYKFLSELEFYFVFSQQYNSDTSDKKVGSVELDNTIKDVQCKLGSKYTVAKIEHLRNNALYNSENIIKEIIEKLCKEAENDGKHTGAAE